MRRSVRIASLTVLCLALTAPVAFADVHDGGEGLWGETNDKVITNAGFFLIAFFPVVISAVSGSVSTTTACIPLAKVD